MICFDLILLGLMLLRADFFGIRIWSVWLHAHCREHAILLFVVHKFFSQIYISLSNPWVFPADFLITFHLCHRCRSSALLTRRICSALLRICACFVFHPCFGAIFSRFQIVNYSSVALMPFAAPLLASLSALGMSSLKISSQQLQLNPY